MAREPGIALSLGIVLAMAMFVLAITTWVAPQDHTSASTPSIRPSEVIYRPQHLNVY